MTSRSLLLALDASSALPQLVALALELAERLDVHLEGLFLEDLDLLRSAEIEFVHRISLLTAAEERFDLSSTERELRAQVNRARHSLQEAAHQRQVTWTFRTLRARREELVEQPASMLLLQGQRMARSRDSAWSCAPTIVLSPEGATPGLLELAARLAAKTGALDVLVVGGAHEAYERAVQQLHDVVAPTVRVSGSRVQEVDLVPTLRKLSGCLLIVERSSSHWRQVVRAVEGPVVVVQPGPDG